MDKHIRGSGAPSLPRAAPRPSLSSFAGVAAGVTGLITKPVEGASEKGLLGFVGGLGQGIAGVALKPVAGVFDLAACTTEGLQSGVNSGSRVIRVRYPRPLMDGVLQPYEEVPPPPPLWP